MIRRIVVALLVTVGAVSLAADTTFLETYHPFVDAQRLRVRECLGREPANNTNRFECPNANVIWRGALDFTLSDPDRTVTLEVNGKGIPIRLETMPMFLSSVLEGDLNVDRKPDYVIKLNWGGNGVIWDMAVIVFALSGPNGHTIRAINSLTFDPSALVMLQGKPTVLHAALVGANGTDGRNHNYFVFTPLEIRKDTLVAGSKRTWIQYTYRPNHTPARNLSEAEKARAWAEAKPDVLVSVNR